MRKGERDESSDMGDVWREIRRERQEKRSRNRENGAAMLAAAGHRFDDPNHGRHLIVEGRVDYWPGTGPWRQRGGPARGRGIRTLLRFLGSVKRKPNISHERTDQ